MTRLFTTALAVAAATAATATAPLPAYAATPWQTLDGAAPLIIGHRGASGYLPEHTLASYALAISQGANVIEPDLVMTQDGHLIARHEPMLDTTTDVATKFGASRMATRLVDGQSTTAYFAQDFTLAEIKTLRAVQARAGRDMSFNGQYEIPTLDEVVALAQTQSASLGRSIGIYPEVKHSTFHAATFGANAIENALVAKLHAAYGNTVNAPVFIQSFEVANLQYLNSVTNLKLVQLVDADDVKPDGSLSLVAPFDKPYDFAAAGDARSFADLLTPAGLAFVKTYADGIGPWKPYLVTTVADGVDRNGDGAVNANDRRVDGATSVIADAHAAGLFVHTWTFRNDASQYGFAGGAAGGQAEMQYYLGLGVDGVFTDFPDTGVAALTAAAVPEPGTWALLASGLLAVGWRARRRD